MTPTMSRPSPGLSGSRTELWNTTLGYSIGSLVRDKDGISAALVLVDLAAHAKSRGETLLDGLDRLARRYGQYVSAQRAVVMRGDAGAHRIAKIMANIRSAPPRSIGGREVLEVTDIQRLTHTHLRTGATTEVDLPRSNVLAFAVQGGVRVLARPSGTEPKIKFYFEVSEPVGEDGVSAARRRGEVTLAQLEADLLEQIGLCG